MKVETVIKNYKLLSPEDKLKFQKETWLKNMPFYCDECEQYKEWIGEIK